MELKANNWSLAGLFRLMFYLPELPYAYDALEPHLDKETMTIHHDKHHAAYVQNLNDALSLHPQLLEMDIADLLKSLDKVPKEIRIKVRNNGGGHANHSLFWEIMAPNAGGEPSGEVKTAIEAAFGGYPAFQEKFAASGLARFGSGWVWLASDKGKLAIVETPNQDTPLMEGKVVILGLDVWEHAYYLKYQNRRADYIKAWWNVVDWREVEKRFKASL